MKKISLGLLLAGSCLAATPALAQDANATFTGPRIEVLAGYDILGAGSEEDDDSEFDNDQDIDGFLYGVGVGFDFAAGGVVLGIEGEYSDSTGEVEITDDGEINSFGFGNVNAGRDLYVGLRAGILADPATLVYVKGGYTNAQLEVDGTLFGDDDDAFDDDSPFNRQFELDGYRIGAGIERAFGTNTFGKLEYRYSNYSSADLEFDDDVTLVDDIGIDTDRHQIVAGFGVRF